MDTEHKLRKVTLNLFDEDCVKLERWYGHGWSTEIRNRIHKFVIDRETYKQQIEELNRAK